MMHDCGILYSAFTAYVRLARDRGTENTICATWFLPDKAAENDIALCLEVEGVNRYETNVLNTVAQSVSFVKRGGMSNLGCFHQKRLRLRKTLPLFYEQSFQELACYKKVNGHGPGSGPMSLQK